MKKPLPRKEFHQNQPYMYKNGEAIQIFSIRLYDRLFLIHFSQHQSLFSKTYSIFLFYFESLGHSRSNCVEWRQASRVGEKFSLIAVVEVTLLKNNSCDIPSELFACVFFLSYDLLFVYSFHPFSHSFLYPPDNLNFR